MLKVLLKNQTVQVDARERGTAENLKWDPVAKDIHIHKRIRLRVGVSAITPIVQGHSIINGAGEAFGVNTPCCRVCFTLWNNPASGNAIRRVQSRVV